MPPTDTGSSHRIVPQRLTHVGLWRPGRRDLAALAVIVIFACLLCAPVITGKVPVPAETLGLWSPWNQLPHQTVTNPNLADATLIYLPSMVFAREAISQGEWPLWDPYAFGGFPYAANSQSQLYYPLTWLLWLLPLSGALQVLTLFNVVLAASGMYCFARDRGLSAVAALLAGLAFGGSGMLQLALEMPGVASVYGWLPWILFAAARALLRESAAWTAAAALLCGVQAVAGHLQWVIYTYFALACWVLWLGLFRPSKRTFKRFGVTLLRGLVIGAGGVAIAAVHLVPFMELVGLSDRAGARVSSNSWPLTYLLRLLAPEYFGTAVPGQGIPMVFNDLWYVGLAPLLLAAIGVFLRPGREVWLWLGFCVLAVLVTFGIGPFLYARWLPGLSGLLPMRIGYLFIFGASILAGMGVDALLRRKLPRSLTAMSILLPALAAGVALGAAWYANLGEAQAIFAAHKEQVLVRATVLLIVSALLLLGMSVWRIGQPLLMRLAITCIVVLAAIDLITTAPAYNSFVGPEEVLPVAPSVIWIKEHAGYERIMGLDSPGPVFNPNTQTLYGFYSVHGYDSLHSRRLSEFWGAVDPTVRPPARGSAYSNVFLRPQAYASHQANLMNVRYLASAQPSEALASLPVAYTGEIMVYENSGALPRVFLVKSARRVPPAEMLALLADPNFDPSEEVLLEEELPLRPSAVGETAGTATIESYDRNSVSITASVDTPSWLVLGDQHYPGWQVEVDGHPARIYTAYYLLRAVPLDPGEHTVVFKYLPSYWLPAAVTSLIALLAVTATLVKSSMRSHR